MANNMIERVCDSFVPLFKQMFVGRVAIGIAGSVGKGRIDKYSDIDFRLYFDKWVDGDKLKKLNKAIVDAIAEYAKEEVKVDGYFPREIAYINKTVDEWQSGKGVTPSLIWTIWGYHPMTDLINQYIVYDSDGLIKGWQDKLEKYTDELKFAVIDKHMLSAFYWRDDYHYFNKVQRGDVVYAVGIASKVVHNLIQVLFAVNEVYYVGDGKNVEYLRDFKLIPKGFIDKIQKVLLPGDDYDCIITQRELLITMINDAEALLSANGYDRTNKIRPHS